MFLRNFLTVAVSLCSLTLVSCKSFSLAPGQELPNYPVEDMTGKEVNLRDIVKGPALLVFFATWCGPCQEEVPELNAIYRAFHDKGFNVAAVAMDQTPDDLKQFVKELKPEYLIFYDGKELYKKPLKITGFPEAVVIDAQQKLVMLTEPDGEMELKVIGGRRWTARNFTSLFQSLLK